MKRAAFLLPLILLLPGLLLAQRTLQLENCLVLAVENNIQVKIGQNSLDIAELTQVQKKFDFLPAVNANVPLNQSFGRTADLYTASVAKTLTQSTPSLVASIVLFRGFTKWSDLKSADYNRISSQYSLEDLKNDIRLNTALAFFQAVYAQENLNVVKARMDLLQKQLERVDHQIAAGTKTDGDRISLKAQLATEQVNEISQANAVNRAILDLALLLDLPPGEEYVLERPASWDDDMPTLEDPRAIFEEAQLNNPAILKQRFKALSTKYAIKSAQSFYYPSLSMNAGFSSFYSSNVRPVTGFVLVGGLPQFTYGKTTPFFEQMNDNFSKVFSFTLNVPVFSRFATRQNVRISRENYETALLGIEAEEQDLFRSIYQAHLDAQAADAKYAATVIQLESLEENLRYAQARFEAGMLDSYAFMEVLSNKSRAEVELLQARYDRMLKRKILDLYQGKTLEF